eukprot:358277-Chlamydomonas_euryale.AAC.8
MKATSSKSATGTWRTERRHANVVGPTPAFGPRRDAPALRQLGRTSAFPFSRVYFTPHAV